MGIHQFIGQAKVGKLTPHIMTSVSGILTYANLYRNRAVENPYKQHSLQKEPSERILHFAISSEKINVRELAVTAGPRSI